MASGDCYFGLWIEARYDKLRSLSVNFDITTVKGI